MPTPQKTFVINPIPYWEPLLLEFSYEFINYKLDMALRKYEMLHRNVTYAEAVDLWRRWRSCPTVR